MLPAGIAPDPSVIWLSWATGAAPCSKFLKIFTHESRPAASPMTHHPGPREFFVYHPSANARARAPLKSSVSCTASHERCHHCTCRGERRVLRHVVADEGVESEAWPDDCFFN
jgi:hypothetical protein